jgi:DNA-directed RNA polymerase specialized sigma24 family protein
VATTEHSYEELAVILGVPSGTLKWRVSEARRRVKQKLAKQGF